MNDSYFELILINNKKNISYLIDTFQENTIKSQEIVIDFINFYRKRFNELEKDVFSLIFRRIIPNYYNGPTENIIKIKDSPVFLFKGNIAALNELIQETRNIKELNNISYKL